MSYGAFAASAYTSLLSTREKKRVREFMAH